MRVDGGERPSAAGVDGRGGPLAGVGVLDKSHAFALAIALAWTSLFAPPAFQLVLGFFFSFFQFWNSLKLPQAHCYQDFQ